MKFVSLHIAVLAAAGVTPVLRAVDDSAELQALREQVRALEQQIKVIARQIEMNEEAAAAAAPTTPKITINDKGFTLASADGASFVKIRGLLQLDSRLFFDDGGGVVNNSFVLRRARLISEGRFAKNHGFQSTAEFGGGSVSILDANFTVALNHALAFKLGKFKAPVGLELLQSDSWTFFNERSLVTNLVPNRDLGVQAFGDVLGGTVSYQLGVFNGVADGASSTNADFDNEKDVAGRVIAAPFKNAAGSSVQGLSFGVAGSLGREKTTAGRTSGYRTDGQQTFFAYNAAALADGASRRVAPQADYRLGSFGAIGEYVVSTINVRPSATGAKTDLKNHAWQLAAGYVLTGEESSCNGVTPHDNFDWSAGAWGAFEVAARYADLEIDDQAFPTSASAAGNADRAQSLGLGLNWYLSKTALFKPDYYQTKFGFSAPAPAIPTTQILRQDEKAFISRFQLAF